MNWKDFQPKEINGNNIVLLPEDDHCSWYGRHMSAETQIELFGIDLWESTTDIENGFIMIKGSLDGNEDNVKVYVNGEDYKDCVKKYIQYVQRVHGEFLEDLDEILLLTPLLETFDLHKIIHFEMDLNEYLKMPIEDRK
jgi:hypothetical protein